MTLNKQLLKINVYLLTHQV